MKFTTTLMGLGCEGLSLTCRFEPSLGGTQRCVEGTAETGAGATVGQTLAEHRVGRVGEGP